MDLYKFLGVMRILPDKERDILCYRYGVTFGETKSLEECGKKFGVTRERIRQIEAKGFDRIWHAIKLD